MYTLANNLATDATFHPMIGYTDGTTLHLAGGLTHDQALKSAHTLATQCEHEQPIEYIGAGLDRIKPYSQPSNDSI